VRTPMGDAVVVGAGVIGLTAAIRLGEAGWRVRVLTADDPLTTTSSVAAALWYPYRAEPREAVLRWGSRSMAVLVALAADPATGIRLLPCRELLAERSPDPWWRPAVDGFARLGPARRPADRPDGWTFTAPVVAMSAFLPWLLGRCAALGVDVERRVVTDLGGIGGDVVVHATGLAARTLLDDAELTPVRGQVVVVADPGLDAVWLDQTDPSRPVYVVPRGSDCVIGGTAEVGEEATEPDPATAAAILRRAAVLEPRLAGARILDHRVGLRPVRSTARVEAEDRGGRRLVHAYGHGGAGVTLAWGVAEDVVALAAGA
jgi:D-amino-acid oxidase